MIFELSKTPSDLRGIYNRCSEKVTFNEAMILHAIEGGSTTLRKLKETSLRNRPYIIRTLSALRERGIVKEKPGRKPREYALTPLGLKSLILLRILTENLMAEEDVTADELVEKIRKFSRDERNLKCLKVCCE